MTLKEPFREAMKRIPGMLKSAPFKDDPRYRGGRLVKPGLDGDMIFKPNILFLIPRIILWIIVFVVFSKEYGFSPGGNNWFLYGLCILDIIFAIPKFLFEQTILKEDGVERTLLFHRKFFLWDGFHQVRRDPLGLSFRMKPAWGIWKDEYNFIISWLYYSPSDIQRVADLFPTELEGHSQRINNSGNEGLMDINP